MIVPHRNAHFSYVTHTIKVVRGLTLIVHVTITGEVHSRVFKPIESFSWRIRPHAAYWLWEEKKLKICSSKYLKVEK